MLNQEESRKDLGFGTKITSEQSRLINKDGSFNVRRVGDSSLNSVNWYHRLITFKWTKFLGLVFLFYFILNLIFASLYLLIGVEYLEGISNDHQQHPFWEAFFFSAQTLTTVGYGRISPTGFWTNAVAAFEALVGLLLIALATGLLYGRFSRSVPRIRFSGHALIAPYLDINGLMFRIIHERDSELIDLDVEMTLSCLDVLPSGAKTRKYYPLELERSHVNYFPLNWTIVHPITEESPLHNATAKSLNETDAEFLIIIRATDETFMQQVHARYSYHHEEILWGAKFEPMFDTSAQGNIAVRVSDIDRHRSASLNT
ncbi:inward rectifier potassium channel Irk [Persicitalea jodogahamensis]|uniref:Inward rectifier potassium channel Irk n=2 Tax=Persicitalea jodogahamensis TaxID=402147 RepID=A0A8J3D5T0_9BACT|nr:inward rectifier potassium channel Irk [Persicitalea jodogahamensis]